MEMTRQQLYELVWSRPLPAAAATFPMSRITLKRICVKHHVPVPPVGYWAKPAAKREATRTPLPAIGMGEQRIWVRRFRQRKAPAPSLAREAKTDRDAWHECTKRTENALGQATPNRRGALIATGLGVASVCVPPETVERALAVLDDLLRAVEKLGYSISLLTSPAVFVIERTQVPFAIFERFLRHDGAPDAAETARRESYAASYPEFVEGMNFLNRWAWRPSGKLMVTIGEGDERRLQHRWADIATHRVEDRIDDMATEAVAHADVIRSRREDLERRLAARREAEEQRRRHEAEAERLQQQFAFLKTRAELFDGVEKIGRLLAHLRGSAAADQSEKMREFLAKAEAHVAELRERCSAEAIEQDLIGSEPW
jgi:hypothetical protein